MAFDYTIRSGQKELRCGYTTGTCAALSAMGAATLLLSGTAPETVSLQTPKGIPVTVSPAQCELVGGAAQCTIIKDAGDDVDVTNGMAVVATVCKTPGSNIVIDGGVGVGRVTKPGLDQPVGAAAINRVPRCMIGEAVRTVCDAHDYKSGLLVVISIPDGEAVAKRTFNPMLGVVGGLSVLGTSGIVEPMSEQALVDTIAVEIRQAAALGAKQIILSPGNYGCNFLRAQGWHIREVPVIKCSNFIGDALDLATTQRFESVLLVGHIGKLCKLAGGVMNTHSRYADCRTELFCAHAAVCGAGAEVCAELLNAATTDACIEILDTANLRKAVMQRLMAAIGLHLERRVAGAYRIGALTFSNQYGVLGSTETATELLDEWQKEDF